VKKFNLGRAKSLAWSVLAVLILLAYWPSQDSTSDNVHTRRFCAYGELFIEFQQGTTVWGTTFLDERGRPVSCLENDSHQPMIGKEVI
jgi:hypothetical protein